MQRKHGAGSPPRGTTRRRCSAALGPPREPSCLHNTAAALPRSSPQGRGAARDGVHQPVRPQRLPLRDAGVPPLPVVSGAVHLSNHRKPGGCGQQLLRFAWAGGWVVRRRAPQWGGTPHARAAVGRHTPHPPPLWRSPATCRPASRACCRWRVTRHPWSSACRPLHSSLAGRQVWCMRRAGVLVHSFQKAAATERASRGRCMRWVTA